MYLHRVALFIFAFLPPVVAVQSVAKQSQKKNDAFLDALTLNATALTLFEKSRSSYEKTYNHFGRVPAELDLPANAVSMDFEIETFSMLQMTPQLVLERGGVEFGLKSGGKGRASQNTDAEEEPLSVSWPKVSDYFSMGIDGVGKKEGQDPKALRSNEKDSRRSYRQSFGGQIEIETALMRPKDVIESNFTKQLQSVMNRLWAEKRNDSDGEHWSPLPFSGAKGINIRVSPKGNPSASCDSCHVQWTAGIVLQQVPSLLAMTASDHLRKLLQIVDRTCSDRAEGCTPEYKAFVSLAAWTLKAVRSCGNCAHPKRCLQPWLVRTHFGDLATHLQNKLGADALKNMFNDVLTAAGARSIDTILPHGVVDYVRFPEMAEMSGMVFPRARLHNSDGEGKDMKDMPTTPKGLLQLATEMVKQREHVSERLLKRGCGIHGPNAALSSELTAGDWLRGMYSGKDLMSDYDSPISQSSFSRLVWKSMGSWRMKPGSNRVYLECRHTDLCLGIGNWPGPAALIRKVGERMLKFEQDASPERHDNDAVRTPIMRQESRDKNFKAEIKALGQVF